MIVRLQSCEIVDFHVCDICSNEIDFRELLQTYAIDDKTKTRFILKILRIFLNQKVFEFIVQYVNEFCENFSQIIRRVMYRQSRTFRECVANFRNHCQNLLIEFEKFI